MPVTSAALATLTTAAGLVVAATPLAATLLAASSLVGVLALADPADVGALGDGDAAGVTSMSFGLRTVPVDPSREDVNADRRTRLRDRPSAARSRDGRPTLTGAGLYPVHSRG